MARIRYSLEIREQAVKLDLESHLTLADAAKQIGCNPNSVHKWIKNFKQHRTDTISFMNTDFQLM